MPPSSELKIEAAGPCTLLLIIHQTTLCHTPEAGDINIHHCENLKFYFIFYFTFFCVKITLYEWCSPVIDFVWNLYLKLNLELYSYCQSPYMHIKINLPGYIVKYPLNWKVLQMKSVEVNGSNVWFFNTVSDLISHHFI